jgi:hypothetical protein
MVSLDIFNLKKDKKQHLDLVQSVPSYLFPLPYFPNTNNITAPNGQQHAIRLPRRNKNYSPNNTLLSLITYE